MFCMRGIDMIGNITFWLLVVIAAAWTFGCITTSHGKTMFLSTLVLWAIAVFFWIHKDISRLHILWAAPVLFIMETLIEIPIRRKLRDRATDRQVESMRKR